MNGWINRKSLDQALKDHPECVRENDEIFRELHPSMEKSFDVAIAANDFKQIRESAHILKTRLRMLYFESLGDLAAAIEQRAAHNQLEGMQVVYSELKRGIAEALDELRLLLAENRE
jgi:HPt (histidine-containing phosphotransfer) domain-containing protein